MRHPQNCSVLTCSNHTKLKLVFNGIFVPGEGLFQGVGSPQGPLHPAKGAMRWSQEFHGKFARRTSLTTTWILRPRRSTVLAEHDSQVPNVTQKEGSQYEFSYVVLPRLIDDEFFKMIPDQMWQFVEICHMTSFKLFCAIRNCATNLFPHIFSLLLSGPCSFALEVDNCL